MNDYPYALSAQSVEPIGIDFSGQIPTGYTLGDVEAWLIDPDRVYTQVDPANIAVSSPNVTVTVGTFVKLGDWKLQVLAECVGSPPVPQVAFRIGFTVAWDTTGTAT